MLEYILIGIGVLNIILLICLLLRKNNNNDLTERLGHFEANINKEIGNFKYEFSNALLKDSNFEKSNKTFMNVLERLTKIDEAQKKIDSLSSEIVSLQSVLTDKKTRGTFGEVNLEYILNNAFGSSQNGIYETQHKFSNGYVADCLLYAPAPLGTIAIDSKFPLENYQRMTSSKNKPVNQYTLEGVFVCSYISVHEAGRQNNIIPSAIANCCRGLKHKTHNYIWRYKEDD